MKKTLTEIYAIQHVFLGRQYKKADVEILTKLQFRNETFPIKRQKYINVI